MAINRGPVGTIDDAGRDRVQINVFEIHAKMGLTQTNRITVGLYSDPSCEELLTQRRNGVKKKRRTPINREQQHGGARGWQRRIGLAGNCQGLKARGH